MELVVIDSSDHDPALNLVQDEELLEKLEQDQVILRFWINSPSIIMGRFQRENLEVSPYAKEKNIPVLRRFSGGGTVYHDYGNLNITIAAHKETLSSLSKVSGSTVCTSIIAESLRNLGFDVEHDEKRNALFCDGKKILGSAASIKGNRYLFHCSLLVDTDLEELNRVLLQKPDYTPEKGAFVKSVRSTVTKLTEIKPDISIPSIKESLEKAVIDKFAISNHRRIVRA